MSFEPKTSAPWCGSTTSNRFSKVLCIRSRRAIGVIFRILLNDKSFSGESQYQNIQLYQTKIRSPTFEPVPNFALLLQPSVRGVTLCRKYTCTGALTFENYFVIDREYDGASWTRAGFRLHDLFFTDCSAPSDAILDRFIYEPVIIKSI